MAARMSAALFIVAVEACFVVGLVVAVSADESYERRSRFWVRVVLFAVFPLALFPLVAADRSLWFKAVGLAWVSLMIALVCVPAALFRRASPPAGPCDDGGHGGSGPDRPPWPPDAPLGGIPLADSEPALARVRDHTGPSFRRQRSHRRSREPERTALATPDNSWSKSARREP